MTDVVVHAEVVRAQEQLAQLQADIAAARQAIADVQIAAAGSVIKSVQRGVIVFATSYPNIVEVTISPVDPAKAFVNLLGCVDRGTSASHMSIELKNATTIKGVSSAANAATINWEVVELY